MRCSFRAASRTSTWEAKSGNLRFMEKLCQTYLEQIPPAILGENSSQCQKTGGGDGERE
ncbi:hypothetical protein [Scytonema hofmannii]|uniref:hypothetical protein n=1 Tax=Scytonema hofmannii TaxID=34078 RepID=UPI00034BAAF2|nr:hypothetical protein [Scytonema hofmannii]